MPINKIIKAIGALLSAIVVGAISSGVWEKVLSPAFNFMSNAVATFLSQLITGYSDKLYTKAAELLILNNNIKTLIYNTIFIVLLIVFLFLMEAKMFLKWRHINANFYKFIDDLISFPLIIIIGGILFFNLGIQIQDQNINKIFMHSNLNMEIARPYIGEQKYLELRSDYLRIKNKTAFDQFEDKLLKYVDGKNLGIKKYNDE